MSGSAGAAPVRYAGIQVQTSALGVQMPVGWGTFRCKCNLVWYNNFKSKAQNAVAKGGTTTGYNYSASIILGLCEGPIVDIPTIWVDAKGYASNTAAPGSAGGYLIKSGAINKVNKTALAQAGLSMATGAIGQAVWSYLTSNYPAQAIGYSGLCIIYAANYPLDSGAGTPQHSFEVQSNFTLQSALNQPDCNPQTVLTDFFTNARYGLPNWAAGLLDSTSFGVYSTYCLAANLLVSPVLDQERQAADFLKEMMTATNSNLCWSEGLLKIVVYGDTTVAGNGATYTPNLTPIYALGDDHFIPHSDGDDALFVDIQDQSDAYNIVQFEYLDRTNAYSTAIATANDTANIEEYGRRKQNSTTVHVICDPTVAQNAAQLYLQRTLYVRKQFKFTVGWQFALLEPGDIVTLSHAAMGLAAYPARIIQIDEDEDGLLAMIAEDLLVGVSHTPVYSNQTGSGVSPNVNVDPGGVEANLLLWSGDQTQAPYTLSHLTVTGPSANDQYGLATGCILVPDTTSNPHYVEQSFSAFAGANYTFSICIQKNAHRNARVYLTDAGFSNYASIDVDTNAGVVLAAGSATGNATLISAAMTPTLVSGIWQVTVTAIFPTQTTLYGAVAALSDAGALTWTGDASNALSVSQWAVRQGVAPGVYAQTTTVIAGPVIFNPPSALTGGVPATWAAVAGGPNYSGCNVWVSLDGGTTYQQIGQTANGPARFGVLSASLALHADPDTADTLSVNLGGSGGALTTAADAVADQSGTLCLVDSELISFSTATLTNPSRYNLISYIRRGCLNTAVAAHAAGATFVRLDEAIFDFPFLATQAGQTTFVKFQPFNAWGEGVTPLTDCNAYSFMPANVGASGPGGSAWSATAGVLTNGGQQVPAIIVTGTSDNPSAQMVDVFIRPTGSGNWSPAAKVSNTSVATTINVTSVAPLQTYDVGLAYQVNGVIGAIVEIAGAITTGTIGTAVTPGSVLFDSHISGTWAYTCVSGSYGHVDVEIWGADGNNTYFSNPEEPGIKAAGGAGGYSETAGHAATPGSTSFAGTIGAATGGQTTCATLSMTANGGANASGLTAGAGGTASGGGTTNATGATGGAQYIPSNGRVRITART